jgi:hypothetical protein
MRASPFTRYQGGQGSQQQQQQHQQQQRQQQAPPPLQKHLQSIRADELEKLEGDVEQLKLKLDASERLLDSEPLLALNSEQVLNVLDFLEQCKPRVVELVEAAAMGLLSDRFLADILAVNDRLCATVARLDGSAPRSAEPRQTPHAPKPVLPSTPVPMLKAPPKARPESAGALFASSSQSPLFAPPSRPWAPTAPPATTAAVSGRAAAAAAPAPAPVAPKAGAAQPIKSVKVSAEDDPFAFFASLDSNDDSKPLAPGPRSRDESDEGETFIDSSSPKAKSSDRWGGGAL